jgi:AcrR family transcriptional regulator
MSTAERKERERIRRRNEIIDAAEKLFFTKGYENVTMDDIAVETELARGTLYLYFKNKEDIYVVIALRAAFILNRMFKECLRDGMTGIEKARTLSLTYSEFNQKYPGYYKAYYYSRLFTNENSSELEELRKIRVESFRMCAEAFAEGKSDGTVREDIDPVKTTLIMMYSLQNAFEYTPAVGALSKNFGVKQDELVDYTINLIIRSASN